jgi:hypothetical protein
MFGFDPLGDFITNLWEGTSTLMVGAFGRLFAMGQADYSASWFIHTYELSFGIAITVYAILVTLNIFQLGTGKLDGGQFTRNMTYRTVGFFYGVSLGPLIGKQLAVFSASLAKDFLIFGVTGSASDIRDSAYADAQSNGVIAQLAKNTMDAIDGGLAGGRLVEIVIGFVLSLTLVALTILVMVITMLQYIAGAFFPILFVFIMSARHRGLAKKFLGVTVALYAVLPAAAFIIAIVMRAFGSYKFSKNATDPMGNLMFSGSLAVGLVMAIAIPLATLMMLIRQGMSVAQGGHQMVTAGAGGTLGAGGAGKVASSNASMSSMAPKFAAVGGGVAATAATGGAAAPVAVGAAASTTTAASGTAAAGTAASAGSATSAVAGGASSTSAGASTATATGQRLRAGQQLAGAAEEAARRPQAGASQGTQNAFYGSQMLDENEREALDR